MADIELEHAQLDVVLQSVADKIRVTAKRDLAQKILAVIEQTNPYLTFGSANGSMMKKCVVAGLQSLFINEGINLTQQPDGGEGDG